METEWGKVLELALQQGIWAVLYIYLFLRILKEHSARESKYQEMITQLSDGIEAGIKRIQAQYQQSQKNFPED